MMMEKVPLPTTDPKDSSGIKTIDALNYTDTCNPYTALGFPPPI
jgi:hypothetical protein